MVEQALIKGLRELLESMSIEEILDEQNVEPEEALLALYEIGLLDLERYLDTQEPASTDED